MKATCECGNIEIDWDTSLLELVARRCGCSYCKLQNAEYVSDSKSTLAFRVLDSSMLNVVRHGTGTSLFHECKNCGLVIVTSEIEGRTYGVLNIKVLGLKGYSVDPIIKDFIAETAKERLARRKRNWCKVAAILINGSKVDITNKTYDAKGDAETEDEAMCVALRQDQEDLSAFDERANESTISHEELLDDLRLHGVLTSTRKQT